MYLFCGAMTKDVISFDEKKFYSILFYSIKCLQKFFCTGGEGILIRATAYLKGPS